MSDTKGQRCCEQGNFGELHDCAKGQSAESTASTFEEEALKMFDEARNEAALFGDFRNRLVAWFSSKLQKQAASEYERGRREVGEHVGKILDSDNDWEDRQTAVYSYLDSLKMAATSGTPAEHNPARAPHNKFASLWCDACPRPTSGTPAPRTTPTPVTFSEMDHPQDLSLSEQCCDMCGISFFFLESKDGDCSTQEVTFCPGCGGSRAQAAPPPADETLPAGAPTFSVYEIIEACAKDLTKWQQELERTDGGAGGHGRSVPYSKGLLLARNYLSAQPAQPSGAQGLRTNADLIKRANGWNEHDLRKFPSATLELIDTLAEAPAAPATTPDEDEPMACPNCGSIECCGLNCGPAQAAAPDTTPTEPELAEARLSIPAHHDDDDRLWLAAEEKRLAALVLSRINHAWLASATPRPDLIAVSEKVWGARFDGQMVCAPTIEEAVTVLRSGLAAQDKPPAAPLCGKRIPETGLGCTLEPGHQGRHDVDVTKVSEAPTPPAAPRFGALKAKRDYPQHWDVATCISAHLEEEGLIKIGLEGVRAQEIVRLWLAAQEKP